MKSFSRVIFTACMLFVFAASIVHSDESPQERLLRERGCERGLIVNADDLGRTPQGNEGILKGFREGTLTSTSLMVPALAAEEAFELIKENPDLDVGVHLTLARDDSDNNFYGPLTDAPSLIDKDGWFITDIETIRKQADKKEAADELYAQVKTAYDHGVDVTHLDCHKGFYHTFDPKTLTPTLKIAAKFDLPIRWVGSSKDPKLMKYGIAVPDFMTGIPMDTPHEEKKEKVINIIRALKPGITEIYFHPAANGMRGDAREERQSELDIVTDPDIINVIKEENVCLIGYRDLRDMQRKIRAEKEVDRQTEK